MYVSDTVLTTHVVVVDPALGALTGMSSAGLTVHEANLEESAITFDGFPWLLRLRYVMENAANIDEAVAIWKATNNTVGFNHMVGSATDRAAVVMETMANYTAFFSADDPREANATYRDPGTGASIAIGHPLEDAVFRTNHGYDNVIRSKYLWSQAPSSWSMERYTMIHNVLSEYQAAGRKIGLFEAANLTAVVGDKGHDMTTCHNSTNGTNVLSVAFAPAEAVMAAAWERGDGADWRPACCSSYLVLNMSSWF